MAAVPGVITAKSIGIDRAHRKVIFASSLGAVFEWYDFYLYGSLAAIIGKQFFAGVNDTTAFIFALLAFSAGFAVRPLGALFFGRLGDLVGRKYTFLITIIIMGAATGLVGVLPSYATIGVAAPIILVVLRMLQGLAIGGEYGGAATYVAEHAPHGQRGYYTSWIQTTATSGLVLSLIVILSCRYLFGDQFETYGWRAPFLVSIVLLTVSVYIRLQLEESPVFHEMRSEGKLSAAPISESFTNWNNLRVVFLALFGAVAGQAVIAYCGLIYMALFLEQTLKVDGATTIDPEEHGRHDLVISRMVMEHVRDAARAWANMANLLAPGGVALAFHPTLYAPPFVINWLTPERLTAPVLKFFFPDRHDGDFPKFPARYGLCTADPAVVEPALGRAGFREVLSAPFWGDRYFRHLPGVRSANDALSALAETRDWRWLASYAYTIGRK